MKHLTTHGILLHKYPIKENDIRATWYTNEYGRITTNIRGAKKINSKFSGNLDYLNLCTLNIYEGKGSHLLTECTAIHSFPQIKKSLPKMDCCFEILKTIRHITYENEHTDHIDELFNLTLEILNTVEAEKNTPLIEELFKIKLLKIMGLLPGLKECSHCNQGFSEKQMASLSKKGSIICEKCTDHFPVEKKLNFNHLKLWNFLSTQPIKSIKQIKIQQKEVLRFRELINSCFSLHFHHSQDRDYLQELA